jgi:DNA-binding response OmpR family regulator
MVKLHHGEIRVESEVGLGTRFFVLLPLGREHLREEEIDASQQHVMKAEPEGSAVNSQQSAMEPETWNLAPGTKKEEPGIRITEPKIINNASILLIVEDNPAMRAFIRGFFDEEYRVLEAGDGQEGLDLAIRYIPDIVISDVMMPVMDGYELCRKIKTDEKTSHIPLILLTARASKESRLEGLETGADDFIIKPFDREELQVRVKNLIHQRKNLSEHYRKGFEPTLDRTHSPILSRDEQFLKKAQTVVEANLSDPEYGVDRFASDMALSRVQLHRKLRALVDQSVTEFIRTIRLNYATILLQNRAGTIAEIAYDAGFNSPTWFTISFKKKYGISPSEYLDQLDNK